MKASLDQSLLFMIPSHSKCTSCASRPQNYQSTSRSCTVTTDRGRRRRGKSRRSWRKRERSTRKGKQRRSLESSLGSELLGNHLNISGVELLTFIKYIIFNW